jgi:hypothetical protein
MNFLKTRIDPTKKDSILYEKHMLEQWDEILHYGDHLIVMNDNNWTNVFIIENYINHGILPVNTITTPKYLFSKKIIEDIFIFLMKIDWISILNFEVFIQSQN